MACCFPRSRIGGLGISVGGLSQHVLIIHSLKSKLGKVLFTVNGNLDGAWDVRHQEGAKDIKAKHHMLDTEKKGEMFLEDFFFQEHNLLLPQK